MFATILGWLTSAGFPNFVYVAALALLAAHLWLAQHIIRRARRRYRNLDSLHRTLVARYYEQLAKSGAVLSGDDRELLESVAAEIAGELEANLIDAEAVNVATLPAPVVEIEYPDYLVELALTIHHHPADEDEQTDEDQEEPATASAGVGGHHGR